MKMSRQWHFSFKHYLSLFIYKKKKRVERYNLISCKTTKILPCIGEPPPACPAVGWWWECFLIRENSPPRNPGPRPRVHGQNVGACQHVLCCCSMIVQPRRVQPSPYCSRWHCQLQTTCYVYAVGEWVFTSLLKHFPIFFDSSFFGCSRYLSSLQISFLDISFNPEIHCWFRNSKRPWYFCGRWSCHWHPQDPIP